jgi:hypothetical protein
MSDQVDNLQRLIRDLVRENADLRTKLTYAEDAASKGDLARQNASGMEIRIKELEDENKELREALEGMMKGQVIEDGAVTVRSGPHPEDILRAHKVLTKPT